MIDPPGTEGGNSFLDDVGPDLWGFGGWGRDRGRGSLGREPDAILLKPDFYDVI